MSALSHQQTLRDVQPCTATIEAAATAGNREFSAGQIERLLPAEALFPQLPCMLRYGGRTIYRYQDLRHSETRRRFAI